MTNHKLRWALLAAVFAIGCALWLDFGAEPSADATERASSYTPSAYEHTRSSGTPVAVEPEATRRDVDPATLTTSVAGRVIERDHGYRLAGVEVTFRFASEGSGSTTSTARSDVDGRFAVETPADWTEAAVAVAEPFFLVSPRTLRRGDLAVEVVVAVPHRLFTARVQDPDGRPVAGLRLGLVYPKPSTATPQHRATSGAGGGIVFLLPNSSSEPFRVTILEDVARSEYLLEQPEATYAPGDLDVPIVVVPWPRDTVRFRLAMSDGAAAEFCYVLCHLGSTAGIPAAGFPRTACEPDADGWIELGLRSGDSGRIQFFVEAGERLGATDVVGYAVPQPPQVLDVRWESTLEVLVVDDHGAPIADAQVDAVASAAADETMTNWTAPAIDRTAAVAIRDGRGVGPLLLDEGVTDRDGLVVVGRGSDDVCFVRVRTAGSLLVVDRVPRNVTRHKVRLSLGARVRGVLPPQHLAAARQGHDPVGDLEVVLRSPDGDLHPSGGAAIAADGSFELAGVPAGPWELYWFGASRVVPVARPLGAALRRLDLAAGEVVDLGILDGAASAPGSLRGVITCRGISPGDRTSLEARHRAGQVLRAALDTSGAFTLPNLDVGSWALRIVVESEERAASIALDPIEITAGAARSISADVTLEEVTIDFGTHRDRVAGRDVCLVDRSSAGRTWVRFRAGDRSSARIPARGTFDVHLDSASGERLGELVRNLMVPTATVR